jgi:hypothetical protein
VKIGAFPWGDGVQGKGGLECSRGARIKMFNHDPGTSLASHSFGGVKEWTTRAPILALSDPDPALGFPAGHHGSVLADSLAYLSRVPDASDPRGLIQRRPVWNSNPSATSQS